jgi:hypothetical protein
MRYAQGQQSGAFRFNEARWKQILNWKPMFSNWLEKWRKHLCQSFMITSFTIAIGDSERRRLGDDTESLQSVHFELKRTDSVQNLVEQLQRLT